jgi:hypothetical protein
MPRSDKQEFERRVREVADHLIQLPLTSNFELHDIFCPKYGVEWRQIDRYAAQARKFNGVRLKEYMDRERAAKLGVSVLLGLLKSPSDRVRLKAEEQLRAALGYGAAPRLPEDGEGNTQQFVPIAVNPADIVGDGSKRNA